MEIRNNTPSFGMAVRKPSQAILEEISGMMPARNFKAFIKEQAKLKNIDITLGKDAWGMFATLKAKEGVNTHGCTIPSSAWRFDKEHDTIDVELGKGIGKSIEFLQKHPKLAESKIIRTAFKIKDFCKYFPKILYTYALKPERALPAGLREAGDAAVIWDKAISERAKAIKEFSELM